MQPIDPKEYSPERIQRLCSGIPFFNKVLHTDPAQFKQLMNCAELLLAKPGDTVIQQGDTDTYLYFLLSGQLAVTGFAGKELNEISPGEVFGALAMLMEVPRTATIRVSRTAREAVVARLDYAHFRNVQETSAFTLDTKLGFYRMLADNIRWTLEMNKMQNPTHPLVASIRSLPIYNGPKGTQEELQALHDQSHKLGDILCKWNASGNAEVG